MGDPATVIENPHRFAPAAPGESHVYGACAPGWHSAAPYAVAMEEWIDFVRGRGVERVCCLLPGKELEADDGNVGLYRAAFGRENVLHAPVPDNHLVGLDRLREDVLPFLASSVEQDAPTVVHCLDGLGRTGYVLAAWLVAGRDYEPLDALATVRELGRDPYESVQRGRATRRVLLCRLERLR